MDLKKKLLNMVRTTLTDATDADIRYEGSVKKESILMMANAKKQWVLDYQQDRDKKRDYIR